MPRPRTQKITKQKTPQPQPRVWLMTLGCPKNEVDSEETLAELLTADFTLATGAADADLILLNTCAFIQSAREETENAIRKTLTEKRRRQNLKVAIIGCYAQRYAAEALQKFPQLDGVLGLGAAGTLAAQCRRILSGQNTLCGFTPQKKIAERPRVMSAGRSYYYLRVADGCDNHCSYCAIPAIRGTLRSRGAAQIIAEGTAATEDFDVRELVLIAQDTTAYGAENGARPQLTTLLRRLIKALPPSARCRVLYAHPARTEQKLLQLINDEPQLCKYLDLPLQHVNDAVLNAMNRRYDHRQIDRILEWRAKYCPTLTLRTSVLVGFPGETASAFKDLLKFVREGHITNLGAFVYSPEVGTPAASLPDTVPPEVAAERYHAIMTAQQKVAFKYLDERIGKTEKVLIDAAEGENLIGRSDAEAPEIDGVIRVAAPKKKSAAIGDYLTVKIIAREDYDLRAVVVGNEG